MLKTMKKSKLRADVKRTRTKMLIAEKQRDSIATRLRIRRMKQNKWCEHKAFYLFSAS